MTTAVVELRPHARRDANTYLGLVIALASWSMMFFGLFFLYAGLRASSTAWPPPGVPRLPLMLPAINTIVIVASSVTVHRALSALRSNQVLLSRKLLGVTVFLGLVFLELQYLLWSQCRGLGVAVDSLYGSVFYGFTWLHAAHIVAGLAALGWAMWRIARGVYTPHHWFPLRSIAFFWHFVDVVWLVMFITIFVF